MAVFNKLRAGFELQKLFLLDAFGACVSALMLGFVLVRLEDVFGIPVNVLFVLAIFPMLFAVYDLYAYFQASSRQAIMLKGIAILNLLYCLLSSLYLIAHLNEITVFGLAYLSIEIVLVICLALFELSIWKQTKQGK